MDEKANKYLFWTAVGLAIALVLILILFAIRRWAQGGQFRNKDLRINGKVVIITGCNTGIGKETALDLAQRGGKIYMACRDHKRCEDARLDIINKTGNKNVFNRTLDLSSLDSIRNFVQEFLEEESQLHILINNAGVMAIPRTETKDGIEMQLGVNHMGHFLLTNLLHDTLKASAPSRIIIVSSSGHLWGRINKEDLNSEKSYGQFVAYMQSKLANNLFSRELSKRLEGSGVVVNCLNPGPVNTDLQRHQMALKWLLSPMLLFFKTPKSGAQTTIRLAVDPELETVTGKYFEDCKEAAQSDAAQDDETAKWLWNVSEQWTGLTPKQNQ